MKQRATLPPAKRLAKFLKDARISQRRFAERVGSHQSIISRIIAAELNPGLRLAVDIERETNGDIPVSAWVNPEKRGSA